MMSIHNLVLLFLIASSESYRILGVFNAVSRSHYILGSTLMRILAERGHDVTVISPFGETNIPNNWKYRDIVLTGFREEWDKLDLNFFDMVDTNIVTMTLILNTVATQSSNDTLNHPNVQKLIHSKEEQFDVIIIEQFMNEEALKGFAYHFSAPYILLNTIGASLVNSFVGNHDNPSYIPEPPLGYLPKMSFWERMHNFLINTFLKLNSHAIVYPKQNLIMKKYFRNAPHLSEIQYNVSLVFINSHVSANQPIPLVPNMIDIGGYHIQPPKELPKDLKDFLDNSPNGVIYLSFGSTTKGSHLPENFRQVFLNVFSKLEQHVLWKFEEDLLGKPPNVKISKWLPQQDILAHPNVKLFITHGGLLSTTETIYHGVPILAIPLFADQKLNAILAENNGIGLKLDYKDIEENILYRKITSLLLNSKFRENAKTRSKIMHDNQNKQIDKVNFWVEYVVRHKGAPI